jgi:hypothetical protein
MSSDQNTFNVKVEYKESDPKDVRRVKVSCNMSLEALLEAVLTAFALKPRYTSNDLQLEFVDEDKEYLIICKDDDITHAFTVMNPHRFYWSFKRPGQSATHIYAYAHTYTHISYHIIHIVCYPSFAPISTHSLLCFVLL